MSVEEKKITLTAAKIRKTFYSPVAVEILKGVDLQLRQGTTTAIMGRSGEGKSTLLHILGTLENPCQGSLKIADCDVSSFNKSKIRSQHIGFVFQSFHLLEDFTVLENVLMPAKIARYPVTKGSESYQRAMWLLEHVGLARHAQRLSKLLSGGEKQRVAIARALCNDPDIIMADEPSGNLDAQTARGIHDLLLNFAHERQKTLVVVTHHEELSRMCDQRYQLREGLLEQMS